LKLLQKAAIYEQPVPTGRGESSVEQKHRVITPFLLLTLEEAGGGQPRQSPGRGGVGEGAVAKHWASSTNISGLGHCRPLAAAVPKCLAVH